MLRGFHPMKIVQVSEITPYSRNARAHSAAQIQWQEHDMHSDRRTRVGRTDDRGNRIQVTLQLDYRLMEQVDAAARRQAISRVALIATWLAERLEDAGSGGARKETL